MQFNDLIEIAEKILQVGDIIVEDDTGKIMLVIHLGMYGLLGDSGTASSTRREIATFFSDINVSKAEYRSNEPVEFGDYKLYILHD